MNKIIKKKNKLSLWRFFKYFAKKYIFHNKFCHTDITYGENIFRLFMKILFLTGFLIYLPFIMLFSFITSLFDF